MTPSELITRKFMSQCELEGVTLPIESLLIQALEGKRKTVSSSGILFSCHISKQLSEPLPSYEFMVTARIVTSLDDDKSGYLFKRNYESLWRVFDFLARGDNCIMLGDSLDAVDPHVFAVDGFQLSGGDDPDFQDDENGGTWSCSFIATLTGRAN